METITALATPPGVSGLAVIRLSGDKAIEIADKRFFGAKKLRSAETQTIHFGEFIGEKQLIDEVTATIFRKPRSYTGEDVVEISCHGGVIVYGEIIKALIRSGARIAEPGEFTKRAFLNGKMDLSQAEAVADIINSQSIAGAQTAARQLEGGFTGKLKEIRSKLVDAASLLELELDFSDEDIDLIERKEIIEKVKDALNYCVELSDSHAAAEILRSGYFVGLAGYPNSGKSTLFNALLERRRAIVSETPGTTRDFLEEDLFLGGTVVKVIDTAGIRDSTDAIEIEGIKFVESALERSNMIAVINDAALSKNNSDKLFEELKEKYQESKVLKIQNKIDKIGDEPKADEETIYVSAKKGVGIDLIRERIEKEAIKSAERVKDVLVNQRQKALLIKSAENLRKAKEALEQGLENELAAYDIRKAAETLGEITGERWSEEVLNNIFGKFCIGK